jgi:hypothetical protein
MSLLDVLQFAWLLALSVYIAYVVLPKATPAQVKDGARMVAKLFAKREQYKDELARIKSPDPVIRMQAAKDIIARRAREREAAKS